MARANIEVFHAPLRPESTSKMHKCIFTEEDLEGTPVKIARKPSLKIEPSDDQLLRAASSQDTIRPYFPAVNYLPRRPPSFELKPNFASFPPLAFSEDSWSHQLTTPSVYLPSYDMSSPILENMFKGVSFHIHVYPQKSLPIFQRGTIITLPNTFIQQNYFYVVEWCQFIEDKYAYLRVNCRDRDQNVVPAYDPIFPAFILAIPLECCDVEFPADLSRYALRYAWPFYPENNFANIRFRARAHLACPASIVWRFCSCL